MGDSLLAPMYLCVFLSAHMGSFRPPPHPPHCLVAVYYFVVHRQLRPVVAIVAPKIPLTHKIHLCPGIRRGASKFGLYGFMAAASQPALPRTDLFYLKEKH